MRRDLVEEAFPGYRGAGGDRGGPAAGLASEFAARLELPEQTNRVTPASVRVESPGVAGQSALEHGDIGVRAVPGAQRPP